MISKESMHKACILIVDDETTNVRLLEKILQAGGFTNVHGISDPRGVLEQYTSLRPDLVLLDIRMPYKDGFRIMAELNELERDDYAPVMVLTAQTDDGTRQRALQLGARDFLTKPFDQIEVVTRICNVLEVRVLHRQIKAHNAELEEKVRERTREVYETRLEIVRRLGRAAEYRDNETGLHIVRMSKYSQVLALAAGMDDRAAELLLTASPLHDLGKIGIPDSILLKPGRLTEEQWRDMRRHPEIGADILDGHDSELLGMARQIALTHHEKWDGSGYPNGLSGTDIPLVGRIVAICDVFDALTTARPYKHAWTVEEAVAEIRAQSGRHFDPRLVETFIEILPEILSIRETYAEPDEPAPVQKAS